MARTHALLLLGLVLPAAPGASAPVVGFLMVDADKHYAEEQRHNPYAARVLAPNGFGFGLAEWHRFLGHSVDAAKTPEMLRRFNVMVIDTPFDFSITQIGETERDRAATARSALEQYLHEGGSALLLLQAVRYPGDRDQDYANLVLEGLGVQMLHEGVFDGRRAFSARIASIFAPEGFFWTENVTHNHPVTEGVTRLCLPQYHNGKTPGVVAPRFSEDWEVLVRGEGSAQSYAVTREHVTDYDRVGTYASAPPIVAVRRFGQGRVMAFSVPARNVHTNYGVPGWNMIVEATGNAEAGLPSDGARLALNGLRWLAEASEGNPALGTFSTAPVDRVRFPESVEFDGHSFPAPAAGIRGLLGAKTALSEGSGTVAEYCEAARRAGLSFIVFNESLEQMTAEDLERLKADCAAASDGAFYACPGLEFADDLGNRWAIWSERVAYPQAQFSRAYGETDADRPTLRQWDGQVMHNPGQYWEYCSYSPNMLLTYANLRDKGAHPANMWWFYRVPPYVYDGASLEADQLSEWLYALRDVRHLNPASYTRLRSPAEVAAAATACATGARDLPSARDWLNTRCGNFSHPAAPYVTGGPAIEQWAAINSQHDWPLEVRGKQRARLRFQVRSPDGIAEVKVHNADYGVIRRFLGGGRQTLAVEFALVHDRDHALTLEVTDTKGRRAISDKAFLFSYKTSLLRCGDNLNFLNGVGLCWHPDRNEMLPLAQAYQGMPAESIGGYDTAFALTHQAVLRLWPVDCVTTEETGQYPQRQEHGILRKILDIPLPGNDVKVCEMDMGPLVWPFDSPTRDTPARTAVPSVVDENGLFSRTHRAHYLQNRTNMYVTWDHRRAREGAERYRGGMVWHEGKITFKRDATLSGDMPIMLFYFTGGAAEGTPTTALIKDAEAGPLAIELPRGEALHRTGTVAPGGYVTAGPCDIYNVFYAGPGREFAYSLHSDPATGRINQLQVGIGRAGQKVTAGSELTYSFAMATLGGPPEKVRDTVAKIDDIARSFGLSGGAGVQVEATVGTVAPGAMFLTATADGHEACFTVQPHRTIIDLPVRLQGIADNGCVAVYSTKRPWLRWIGVSEGQALFQEEVDQGSTIWCGNPFVCGREEVGLTLIDQGLARGHPAFLEVHNPTDSPVTATVVSPPHTPVYGGMQFTVDVPAGSSVNVPVGAP